METIPEVKIEGLEEVLQQLGALSRAIDSVTESARLASSVLSVFFPTDAVRVLLQAASPFGDVDPLLGGSLPAPLGSIARPLSGILIPELNTLLQTISETAEGIRKASGAVSESLNHMKVAVEGFTPAGSGSSYPLSVPIEQEKGFFGWAGSIAEGAGYGYLPVDPRAGATLIGGGLLLQSIEGDGFYDYDEDAANHMKRVQDWGYGDINEVEDGWLINRNMEADRRARNFNDEFAFFNARLKELDKEANVELTPLLDSPAEFGRREQARALRTVYSKDLLDLIEQFKVAVGRDPVVTPTIDVGILSTAHPGVDPRALEIAKTHGISAANSMAGTLFPMAAPGVIKFEPIEMEIKVLSEPPPQYEDKQS